MMGCTTRGMAWKKYSRKGRLLRSSKWKSSAPSPCWEEIPDEVEGWFCRERWSAAEVVAVGTRMGCVEGRPCTSRSASWNKSVSLVSWILFFRNLTLGFVDPEEFLGNINVFNYYLEKD